MGRKNKCMYLGKVYESERECLEDILWSEFYNGNIFTNYKGIKRAYQYEKKCTDKDRENKKRCIELRKEIRVYEDLVYSTIFKEKIRFANMLGLNNFNYNADDFYKDLINELSKELTKEIESIVKPMKEEIKSRPYNVRTNCLYKYTKGKIKVLEK